MASCAIGGEEMSLIIPKSQMTEEDIKFQFVAQPSDRDISLNKQKNRIYMTQEMPI